MEDGRGSGMMVVERIDCKTLLWCEVEEVGKGTRREGATGFVFWFST